jgi:hypothetical protein
MLRLFTVPVLVGMFLGQVLPLSAQELPGLRIPAKKLISFGWDHPNPATFKSNLEKLEANPFDGVGVQLPNTVAGGNVFRVDLWDKVTEQAKADLLAEMAALPKSKVLTDNFVVLYGASAMEWTSDADWKRVLDQARFCARAAKAAGFGILWDGEPYSGRNPWEFSKQPDAKGVAYEKYIETVKARAKQFIVAVQEAYPGVVILSLRQLSDFQDGSPFSAKVFGQPDAKIRADLLTNSYWSMHIPFTEGLLLGMADEVVLHDGNEDAYYYTSAIEYYRVATQLRTEGSQLLSSAVRKKYARQYKIGHAISVEYTSGKWKQLNSFPAELTGQGAELTAAQRAQWFEHNAYHALVSSDEYVWVYAEDLNWAERKNIPEGYLEALRSAKEKYHKGVKLGFEVEEMLHKARQAAAKKAEKK